MMIKTLKDVRMFVDILKWASSQESTLCQWNTNTFFIIYNDSVKFIEKKTCLKISNI